ncbi:MAG TPA: hypothetical protein VNO31_23435 [Umezawaea sp.]|nr:hypothetical protein [Umezawaea sp.]
MHPHHFYVQAFIRQHMEETERAAANHRLARLLSRQRRERSRLGSGAPRRQPDEDRATGRSPHRTEPVRASTTESGTT